MIMANILAAIIAVLLLPLTLFSFPLGAFALFFGGF